ncbi:hypothetical protein H8356DRAFT_1342851 [Neocallimastix lanati (nom. inval.)]|nr:hypothetical protein H8356DRAFT_1342851 [Neocallimastix sp. JGI-2020a]
MVFLSKVASSTKRYKESNSKFEAAVVTLAEWLTRWPAKPFPFGSAGSSPADLNKELLLNLLNTPMMEPMLYGF